MYIYSADSFKAKVWKVGNNRYRIFYPSPVVSDNTINDDVQAVLNVPDKNTKKIMLFVHGLAARKEYGWFQVGRELAEIGYATFFVHLPYHLSRIKNVKETKSKVNFMDGVFGYKFFRQAVFDVLRGIDLLQVMGYEKYGIIGISLGSIISTMAAAMDKRITSIALILGGGDYGILTWDSPIMFKIRKDYKRQGISRADCLKCRSKFENFRNKFLETGDINSVKNKVICFYYDPLTYAPLLKGRKILMINALFDMVIPRESTLKLWRDLGYPTLKYLWTTHTSIAFRKKSVVSIIKQWCKD